MQRIPMNPSLFLILFLSAAAITSCRKEPVTNLTAPESSVTGRAPNGEMVGVSLFDGVNPSQIVTMNDANGNVTLANPVIYAGTYQLTNLKGVCYYAANSYFVTAEAPANAPYTTAFYRVNNATGVADHVLDIPSNIGVISDIEYDAADNVMYGLRNNSNALVIVAGFLGGPAFGVVPINGLPNGYTAQGLAYIGQRVYIAASSPTGVTQVYRVDVGTGAATFIANMLPAVDLDGGHSGLGYDADFKHLVINRTNNPNAPQVVGLNDAPWPLNAPNTTTNTWGADGWDFEDLISVQ